MLRSHRDSLLLAAMSVAAGAAISALEGAGVGALVAAVGLAAAGFKARPRRAQPPAIGVRPVQRPRASLAPAASEPAGRGVLEVPTGPCVVGLGGAGGKILQRLEQVIRQQGFRAIAINSDLADLGTLSNLNRVPAGNELTRGLGCGGDPILGAAAAEAGRAPIGTALGSTKLVVLVVGLGGGFGTGAAPLVARLATQAGARVVAVVCLPLTVEGTRRRARAIAGRDLLAKEVAGLVTLEADEALELSGTATPIAEALGRLERQCLEALLIREAANANQATNPG